MKTVRKSPMRRLSRGERMLKAMGVELPTPKATSQQSPIKSPSPAPSATSDPTPLPLKYSQLLRILENLLMVNRNRAYQLTFSRAKQALTILNTRMEVSHVCQLVHICPELTLKYLPKKRDMGPRDRLLLMIDHSKATSVAKSEAGIMKAARKKLMELADSAEDGEVPEVPQAILPDPSAMYLNTPSRSSGRRGLSSGGKSPCFKSPASIRGPLRVATPINPARGVKRPLSSEGLGLNSAGGLPTVPEGDEFDAQSIGESTPGRSMELDKDMVTPVRRTKRRVYSFERFEEEEGSGIKLTPSAAQALQETLQQRDAMTPERVRARNRGHALAILPKTFDLVRAIFHRDNKTRMPYVTVIEMMRRSQGGKLGPSEETLRLNLQQVLDHASQFLRLEQAAQSSVKMLCIDKTCNIKEVREGLKMVAKNRDLLIQQEEEEANQQGEM